MMMAFNMLENRRFLRCLQEALKEISPLSGVQFANTITHYGTRYTTGMTLSHGSTGGVPAKIIQIVLDSSVYFIVKILSTW